MFRNKTLWQVRPKRTYLCPTSETVLFVKLSQRAHNVEMTSHWRWCDVMQRHLNVMCLLGIVSYKICRYSQVLLIKSHCNGTRLIWVILTSVCMSKVSCSLRTASEWEIWEKKCLEGNWTVLGIDVEDLLQQNCDLSFLPASWKTEYSALQCKGI